MTRPTATFEFDKWALGAALSVDGRYFAVTLAPKAEVGRFSNLSTQIWDVEKRCRIGEINNSEGTLVSAISRHGQKITSVRMLHQEALGQSFERAMPAFTLALELWKLESPEESVSLTEFRSRLSSVFSWPQSAFSDDGNFVAIDLMNGTVVVASTSDGNILAELEAFPPIVELSNPAALMERAGVSRSIAFSHDGRMLYSTSIHEKIDRSAGRIVNIARQQLNWRAEDVGAEAVARLPAGQNVLSEIEVQRYLSFAQLNPKIGESYLTIRPMDKS